MADPTGRIVDELRAAAAAWPAPHTDVIIAGGEAIPPAAIPKDGRAHGPRCILVIRREPRRWKRVPIQTIVVEIRAYDPDERLAAVLIELAVDALHDKGPRVAGTPGARIAIYRSTDVAGSGTLREPDTRYVHERRRVEVIAASTTVA